jgi:hypothetical protein
MKDRRIRFLKIISISFLFSKFDFFKNMGEQGICSTILMIIEIWKEEWHTEWS